MADPTSICVRYKRVEDWHVFVCDELPALYVAHQDARTAFDDVAPSIQALIKLNEGIDCRVVAETSYAEFIQQMHDRQSRREPRSAAPAVTSNKRFLLLPAAA